MKNLFSIYILIVSLTFSGLAHAQRHGVGIGTGIEYTVSGPMSSYFLNVELNRHEIAFMMQSRMSNNGTDIKTSYDFKGICYQYAFYREKHLYTSIALRGGLVNERFVVIVPSLVVGCIFNDYLKVNVTCGMRAQMPSVGINMFVNLPFKSHEYRDAIRTN